MLRKENKEDHEEIKTHSKHTNGTVAELVTWKIQVKTVLWVFGILISTIVIPVGVNILTGYLSK